MMHRADERLNQWLRDAHAMEEQAMSMLDGMASRIENYPELSARIARHAEETRNHARLVEGCLERRGTDTSLVKDVAGRFMGFGQGLSGLVVGDEVIKGSMAGYTFEHMEIAAYKILIAAAEEAGDAPTRTVCEQILQEEQAMADWLSERLIPTTRQYLERELLGVGAKR